MHGTTLVTNAIIERRGAVVGLIATEGFRDTIEIGRETRYDLYDLFLEPCPPLVPRFRRLEVPERVSAEGEILLKLDETAVAAAARRLVEQDGIEALAIAFMHSYRMAAHEQRAAEIVRALYPDLPLTLSAEVAPEIREFERTGTACANAYVQPMMQRYLDRLEASLGEIGLSGRLYVMLSGGGIATVREARNFPIRLIEWVPRPGRWPPPSSPGFAVSTRSSPSTWEGRPRKCAWWRTASRITSSSSRPGGCGASTKAPACRSRFR